MNCDYWDGFFAVLILVFSFWEIGASDVIIIISAAFILIKTISNYIAHGCSMSPDRVDHRTGSELFLEKRSKSNMPSKGEVEEVLEKKTSSKKAKKKTKKKAPKKVKSKR